MGWPGKTRHYAAGAALVLALTGCHAGGQTAEVQVPAAQAIGLASTKTATVKSYKVDLTVGGAGQAHGTVRVRLRPSLAVNAVLDRVGFGGMSLPAGEQVILLGNEVYAKLPSVLANGGKPWVRRSIARGGAGLDVDRLVRLANPADQMKILTDSKDVRRVGTQTIDGVETTHYHGSISPREAVTRLDPNSRAPFRQMYGDQRIAFDVWVDSDNLPRKLVSGFATPQGRVTATMIFSDFNKPVSVSAPPADQVRDDAQPGRSGIPG